MTYEEYVQATQGLTTDNAPEILKGILESVKLDLEERDAYKASIDELNGSIAEKDAKIADLQQTNIKLFLQSAAKPSTSNLTEEAELTVEEYIAKQLRDAGCID